MANKRISVTAETNYHNRVVNGIKTPCSNPDGKPGNNLN